ncbi:MAG: hypothetical protein EPO23_04920 [Xanthobacteraceae bacterium]|nr:MAG: hypothetical protein EPO23_04920 [Xanthobacteraceae bacterium]
MNWAWAGSINELFNAPEFPLWAGAVTLAIFVAMLLVTAARAQKNVANAVLAVLALAGVFSAVALPWFNVSPRAMTPTRQPSTEARIAAPAPALACLDGLAGETVEAACERALFGSPEMIAAAVSYTARQLTRLNAAGVSGTPETVVLRRVLERDRFGFVAHVLAARENCAPNACAAFRVLSDPGRIIANMNARTYDLLVGRAALAWTGGAAPPPFTSATIPTPAQSAPTGKPTTIDFPTAASIPPVSIMTPEQTEPAAAPRPAATVKPKTAARPRAGAPVSLAPTPVAPPAVAEEN